MQKEIPNSFSHGRFVVEKVLDRGGMGVVRMDIPRIESFRVTVNRIWYGVKISGARTASLAIVLSLLVFSGCLGLKSHKREPGKDAQNCDGVSCWKSPSNSCTADNYLNVYAPSGYCSDGECSYATRQEQCHSGICDQGECVSTPCQGLFCIDPPPPYCAADGNRTIFAPSGYCSGGQCSYASKTSTCDFLCESGSCTDSPCAEVYCPKSPAPYCQDDKSLVIFEPKGRCAVVENGPKCLHASQTIACDQGCKDGRCQDDPCVGVICDRPPARYCDGAELVMFEPYGVCGEGGFCAYVEQRHPCIEPCVDAHCGEDEACTSDCKEPPAPYCHDDSVLRVYAREGWCEDGFCFYQYSDKDCPKGCEEGRCKGHPCLWVSCDNPMAAYCDGKVLIEFEQKGTCNDGTCTYRKDETSCMYGCKNAACLTGGDTDTDTETDTNTDMDPQMEWITIPLGEFWMGSPDGNCPVGYPGGEGAKCTPELGRDSDEVLHKVTLTNAFEIMNYEVTQGGFEAAMGWSPSKLNCSFGCGVAYPVYLTSWYDAVAYANKLSIDAALTPCYKITAVTCELDNNPGEHNSYLACFDGSDPGKSGGINVATVELNGVTTPYECVGYRLPTEAEWEYAIRADSWTAFYPSEGNDGSITYEGASPADPNLTQIAWYEGDNLPYGTKPAGGKASNKWGLYDMSGNVWEWVWDWGAAYKADPATDPAGPASGTRRIFRNGAWDGPAGRCRSASRSDTNPSERNNSTGFRLVRTIF